jgi:hypothetical protein
VALSVGLAVLLLRSAVRRTTSADRSQTAPF